MWTDRSGEGKSETATSKNTNEDRLQGGRFLVDVARKKAPLAMAAPGMH
jgi:hypothetical protein